MSKKMDITISRDITINTGNFSSIKPSVSVTLKDIEENILEKEYDRLSELMDSLIALEIIKIGNEMTDIKHHGYEYYIKMLEKVESDMLKTITDFSEGK